MCKLGIFLFPPFVGILKIYIISVIVGIRRIMAQGQKRVAVNVSDFGFDLRE